MPRIAATRTKAPFADFEKLSSCRPNSESAELGSHSRTFGVRTMQFVFHSSPWVNSVPRRCLDCFAAAIALAALSPLMAICTILVRLSSPGPILFRQRRMGRNGIEFDFYKFRSMTMAEVPGAPTHTVQGNRRITRVGAFLRRFKLDELPQFWNVLKGDMSLVGPRPKLPQHEGLFLTCRPGITGEATLTFRNEEQMLVGIPPHEVDAFYESFLKPVKAELDIAYMRNASLKGDLRLLWHTATRCLFHETNPSAEVAKLRAHCVNRKWPSDVFRLIGTNPDNERAHATSDPATAAAD